jgi:hypothetical protein
MDILPYKLDTTNDQLTSRAGLLAIAQLMDSLHLSKRIDSHFPLPSSNRGFKPSEFIQTFILMHHEGSFHLDDVRHLSDDQALRTVLGLKNLPQASTLGAWLRKMGRHQESLPAWREVNKALLKSALHKCKGVTLDIDATEVIANKKEAKWTYKKNKGFMPMVGHIAETGQIVACDFREGNTPPAKENLEFIHQCQQSLPEGCFIKALRIDSAGYQTQIIKHCDNNDIDYAIRAVMSAAIKETIESIKEEQWQPLVDKKGKPAELESTYRTTHLIGDHEKPFTLIIQRKSIRGQASLDLDADATSDEIVSKGYIYRAIATNKDALSDSQIVHWYNQRGEDSENRIKELKLDFGADTLPCSDFKANELYFLLSALSYNLFALMRQLLPVELSHHRATTLRWRLYAVAAKVVKTGRQYFVKLQAKNKELLERVLLTLKEFEPPPI